LAFELLYNIGNIFSQRLLPSVFRRRAWHIVHVA
jgi:hypothetical protein